MSLRRLKLLDTEVVESEGGGYEAIVKLRYQDKNHIGIEKFATDDEQQRVDAVSKAALEALKVALPVPVDLYLKKAIKLTPEFLDDLLIVVMVDIYVDMRRLELTGCCVCMPENLEFGVVRATLDATNRIVEFLFTKYKSKVPNPPTL